MIFSTKFGSLFWLRRLCRFLDSRVCANAVPAVMTRVQLVERWLFRVILRLRLG
jgi:hypothetical protein